MEKILARWKQINTRISELQDTLPEDEAWWNNEEYGDLFEERSRLNTLMSVAKSEVDKQVIKQSYSKENKIATDVLSGKNYTNTKWITINPADGQEKAFIARVHKFMKRPCMEGKYCFEQRGETEGDYHGLHIHALVKDYPNLRRDTVCQFKKFCDKAHVSIKPCTKEDIDRRDIYMMGTKQGAQKQLKILNDPRMREHYALLPFYTC